ncbi:hypothetical protein YC2023_098930 [Brassica napus]
MHGKIRRSLRRANHKQGASLPWFELKVNRYGESQCTKVNRYVQRLGESLCTKIGLDK